jgi:cell wall-associated NlpC family hydrolase
MTADDILAAARQCLGTPFRHQGRLPRFGLDCAGVAIHVARQIGVGHDRRLGYGARRSMGSSKRSLDSQPCLERVAMVDDRRPWRSAADALCGRPAAPGDHRRRHSHPRL